MPDCRIRRRGCATDPVYSAALKFIRCLFTLMVIGAVAAAALWLSMPIMAGRLLRSDPLQKADVIVVLGSARYERTLEAGMLYREGWAPRVLLLRPPDLVRDSLRQKLGLRVPVF